MVQWPLRAEARRQYSARSGPQLALALDAPTDTDPPHKQDRSLHSFGAVGRKDCASVASLDHRQINERKA